MLSLSSPPATTPVSLSEAREELRLVHTNDDTLISRYIDEAVNRMDGYKGWLGEAMITQTWTLTLAAFQDVPFLVPISPVQSISEIRYYDKDNTSQTFLTSDVELQTTGSNTYISIAPTSSWPTTYSRLDAVQFDLVCGYGDTATDVPDNLRGALLHYVYCRYEGMDMSEITSRVRTFTGPVRRIAL